MIRTVSTLSRSYDDEEMRAVAHERTADRYADALLVERRLLRREEVPRVQRVVAAEVETAPAEADSCPIASRP